MPSLMFRFAVGLSRHDLPHYDAPEGPYFHRWLPNGEMDAIDITNGNGLASLKLWFERTGFMDGGFIRYDRKRTEVDPNIMFRQGKLKAGALRGKAVINILLDSEISAIESDSQGSDEYVSAAKKIGKVLQPPLNNFISLLRTKYGQYWLQPLEHWDSRYQSIGADCSSSLFLHWSNDNGTTWNRFKPNESSVMMTVGARTFEECITLSDWEDIKKTFSPTKAPSLAATILSSALEFMDRELYRQAFIEGITALEIAISEFISKKATNNMISESIKSFFQLPLRAQVSTLAISCNLIATQKIDETILSIEVRNEIVHEGKNPSEQNIKLLPALFQMVAAFLEEGTYKFPSINGGNVLYPEAT
jgi:hypothetical protein